MWKLWHRLFGFDYVVISFGLGDDLRRVRWTPTGKPYVCLYGGFEFLETTSRQWTPLTFEKQAERPQLRSAA